MLNKAQGTAPNVRDAFTLRDKAASGDMVFVVTPATKSTAHTSAAWTRTVVVELKTAAGEVHTWFDAALTNGVSVADTSTAGTATIVPASTLTFVKGRATVAVSGDAAAWAAAETDTVTIAQATIMGYTIAAKTSVETFT